MVDAVKIFGSRSEPIFVLGSPRSGTTVISKCLGKLGWPGFDEGHMFDLLLKLTSILDQHSTGYQGEVERTEWAAEYFPYAVLRSSLIGFFEDFMIDRFGHRWHDKTPGTPVLKHTIALKKLLPKAKFIFCRRRGIDVIGSAARRFGSDSAGVRTACDVWVETMMSWISIRDHLHGAYIEIEHRDLIDDKRSVAKNICDFMNLNGDAYSEVENFLMTSTQEQTRFETSPQNLSELNLSSEDKSYILDSCLHCMMMWGYDLEDKKAVLAKRLPIVFSIDPRVVDMSRVGEPSAYKSTGNWRFLLHPAMPGEPATSVSFLDIDARGARYLTTRFHVENSLGGSVVGTISIVSKNLTLVTSSVTSKWDEIKHIALQVPEAVDRFDVVVSTAMADGSLSNAYAWANFIDLCLVY